MNIRECFFFWGTRITLIKRIIYPTFACLCVLPQTSLVITPNHSNYCPCVQSQQVQHAAHIASLGFGELQKQAFVRTCTRLGG